MGESSFQGIIRPQYINVHYRLEGVRAELVDWCKKIARGPGAMFFQLVYPRPVTSADLHHEVQPSKLFHALIHRGLKAFYVPYVD